MKRTCSKEKSEKLRAHTFPLWIKLLYGFFRSAAMCLDSTTTPSLKLVQATICPRRATSWLSCERPIHSILIFLMCVVVNSLEQGPPLLRVHPQVLRTNFVTSFFSFAAISIGPGTEGPGRESLTGFGEWRFVQALLQPHLCRLPSPHRSHIHHLKGKGNSQYLLYFYGVCLTLQ